MSDFDVKEKRFEEDIEDYLTHHGGYTKGDPKKFNRESGLEEDTFVEFIKTSQPKKWERYVKIYAENSEKQIIERFKREVKTTNLLNVMRHGFMDRGIKFYPIFWKPETSLNETTQMQYDANILHCTRQLHYSVHNENSIDIVLFANGIPVVSMELKCQFTGQDTTNAINQYKFDRAGKDAIFAFKERVLVHFAVDLTNVYMTTRLEGAHTYFLPFNQGSNGAGKVGGKGNPVNPNGYDTAYLWERVLCKDSLMEILQKYMHLQQEYDKNGNLVKETMIFPRYHQLDVVTKLLEDVKKNGSGKSYLIQHSAGSGKSNSIAWLAHRLTGLHDYEDNKIFQSVIIVTDRRVLDSQLQSTVYQFDHVEGVVKKVDKNSGQLRDAINDGVGIIITTLQKFPVIYKEVDSAKKRFAIIIDEAHSSQTGDAAKKLKRALADTEEILKEYAEMEDEDERNRKDDEDKLLDELAAQGMHKNLSFFAFTATPKGKTLQLFGQKDAEGIYRPFHIYSMRQAREAVDGRYGKDANRVLRAIDSAEKDCGIRLLEADPKAEGVIGSRVLPKGWVARKPSDIYWNGIRTFGIFCDYGLSIPEYVSLAVKLKEQKSVSRLGNRNDDAEENDKDDSDAGDIGNIRFWNLPIYHDDWRDNLTIELTQEEAFYLDKQIQKSTKGSLLEYVLKNRIDLNEYDDFASLTAELSEKVGEKLAYMMKLACDFNNLVYMARVRYNVMLSEDENTYANDEWSRLLPDIRHNATVDLDAVFGEFQLINPRAKSFLCGIQAAFITLDIDMADELIRKRERSLKGAARAKLSRTKEFDHSKWVGGGMLDYRFSNARRIVNDIYAGEVSADV